MQSSLRNTNKKRWQVLVRSSHVTRQYIRGWNNGNVLSSFWFIFTLLLLSVCSRVPSPRNSKVLETLRFSVLLIVDMKCSKFEVIFCIYLLLILRISRMVFSTLNPLFGLYRVEELVCPTSRNFGKFLFLYVA